MLITVDGEAYIKASNASRGFWASSKPGSYGRGLKNSPEDPTRIERIGILGEIAFAIAANIPYQDNIRYQKYGMLQDFITADGQTVDVKTSLKNRSPVYLKVHDSTLEVASRCMFFMVCGLVHEDAATNTAVIQLHGYQTRSFIQTLPIKPSPIRGATHRNFELDFDSLLPLENLLRKFSNCNTSQ